MKNEDLFRIFSLYGTVEDAYIIFDKATGKSKLFGYVVYDTVEEAERVIQMKFVKDNKRKIFVKLHEKPSQSSRPKEARGTSSVGAVDDKSNSSMHASQRNTKRTEGLGSNQVYPQCLHEYSPE